MISVIIPTRDRPGDLLACLGGLAAQDALHLLSEVIVVDDYSRQSYAAEAERLASSRGLPILLIANRESPGAAVARNIGARSATGKVLAFLDDDAVPATDWLRTISRRLVERDATAITGRILPLDEDRLWSRARQLRYERRQRDAMSAGGPVRFMAGGNSAVWRRAFEEHGGFDHRFVMMHDQDFALRLAASGRSCFYAHDLVICHRHFKGLRLAMRQSFESGYYRIRLERRHAVRAWTPADQARSFATLLQMSEPVHGGYLPALAAMIMESVHSCGYLWYRRQRRDDEHLPPADHPGAPPDVARGPPSRPDGSADRHTDSEVAE